MSEEQAPPTAPAMVVAEAHNIDTYHIPKALFESVKLSMGEEALERQGQC